MDLCLHIANSSHLKTWKNLTDSGVSDMVFNSPSKTDLIYLKSLNLLTEIVGKDIKERVIRLYFGNETCQNLVSSPDSIKMVMEYCREKKYSFTYVTPYVGKVGLEVLRKNLEYINQVSEKGDKIEVVVNDFGVLNLIYDNFHNLIPIIGRLLIKIKRDPRFSIQPYPFRKNYSDDPEKVGKNQSEYFSDSSLSFNLYRMFLKKLHIKRVGIDITRNFNGYPQWGFPVDVYWPWTYITSGRACRIAAIGNPINEVHMTEKKCNFECKQYEYPLLSDMKMNFTVQRGNALWLDSSDLLSLIFKNHFKRLIYAPFIPI